MYQLLDTKFKKALMTLVHKIHKQLFDLEDKVVILTQKIDDQVERRVVNKGQDDWDKLYDNLPINSEEELKEMEQKICTDHGFYDFLVS